MRSQSRTRVPEKLETICSSTPRPDQGYLTRDQMTNRNPNRDQDTTAIKWMLTTLLDNGIKPAIEAQFQAFENMFQRNMLLLLKKQTLNLDKV